MGIIFLKVFPSSYFFRHPKIIFSLLKNSLSDDNHDDTYVLRQQRSDDEDLGSSYVYSTCMLKMALGTLKFLPKANLKIGTVFE